MKALRFHQTGDLANLKVEEVPVPEPRQGEVLVKVKAAAINPADIKNVLGNMKDITTVPRIPGRDFSGIVVGGSKEGQAVFGSGAMLGFNRDGAQAEYVIVPEAAIIPKPDNLSFEAAAALGIPYITAWSAIVDAAQVKPNENVLIIGANGAVGSVAVQIAKWKGARVLGTVRKGSEIQKNSAIDIWINLENQELTSSVLAATENKGAQAALDTVGGPMFEQSLKSLAEKGRHVAIASLEPRVTFNLVDFYRRQLRIIGVNTLKFSFQDSTNILQQLLPMIKEGKLSLPAFKTFTLAQALDAYRQIHAGQLKTKAVINF